jgi:response regulator RpfG family c-di-GMP phosphodiesterase
MIADHSFDLVLMDIQLPDMDGFEATRKIRREFPAPKNNIPVIALTAHGHREEMQMAFESGMDDFLTKPFLPQALFQKISTCLARAEKSKPVNSSSTPTLDEVTNGDEALRAELILIFQSEGPRLAEEIRQAAAGAGKEKLMLHLHTLKSSLRLFDSTEALALLESIESKLKMNDPFPDLLETASNLSQLTLEAVQKSRG